MSRWIRAFKWLTGLLLLAAVALGTWVVAGGPDVAADRDHDRLTHWLLETVRERSVSRRAAELRMPSLEPLTDAKLLTAVASYEDMCAGCHAPPGGEASALARGLNPPAPDLARVAQRRSTEELFWVTRHGIRMTGMPAWGPTHSDAELLPLVALMQQFPGFEDHEYGELLAQARAVGIEHSHDHGDQHDQHGQHDHPAPHRPADKDERDDEEVLEGEKDADRQRQQGGEHEHAH